MIRVSIFSVWSYPSHAEYPDLKSAMEAAREARNMQFAVVLTDARDDEPTEFGVGIVNHTGDLLAEFMRKFNDPKS